MSPLAEVQAVEKAVEAPPFIPFAVHNVTVDNGIEVFYREAGRPSAPTILLLHGYPSSSHQYRNLIPLLAERYHVLAPDFPGFGFTNVPESRNYTYTFDNLAATTSAFLDALKVEKYSVYVFDYGSPVGFRLATAKPSAITAIITQNGNAYEQGLGAAFSALSNYYNDPTNQTNLEAVVNFDSPAGTFFQYTTGAPDPSLVEPESYTLDSALLARPGNLDIQLALFRDYKTNVALYPEWHQYLHQHQPPVLAVWGQNDPFFIPPGAEAFKADVPSTEVHFLDGGHFLLETQVVPVAWFILDFLRRKGIF